VGASPKSERAKNKASGNITPRGGSRIKAGKTTEPRSKGESVGEIKHRVHEKSTTVRRGKHSRVKRGFWGGGTFRAETKDIPEGDRN